MLPNLLPSGCHGRCCWLDPGQGISTTQMAGLAALANERISRPWSRCWTSESCGLSARGLPLVIRYLLARIGLTRQAGPAGPLSAVRCQYHKVTMVGLPSQPVPSRGGFYCCAAPNRCLKACAAPLQVHVDALRCHAVRCWRLYGEPAGDQRRFETREGGPDRDNRTNVVCGRARLKQHYAL